MNKTAEHQLVDVFTSNLSINVDVKKILALSSDQLESSVAISLEMGASIIRKPAELIMLNLGVEGKAEDDRFIFSGTITGLFKSSDPLPKNEDKQALQDLFTQFAPEIWPYVRELASDVSRKLPSQTILRLPMNFPWKITEIHFPTQEIETDQEHAGEGE